MMIKQFGMASGKKRVTTMLLGMLIMLLAFAAPAMALTYAGDDELYTTSSIVLDSGDLTTVGFGVRDANTLGNIMLGYGCGMSGCLSGGSCGGSCVTDSYGFCACGPMASHDGVTANYAPAVITAVSTSSTDFTVSYSAGSLTIKDITGLSAGTYNVSITATYTADTATGIPQSARGTFSVTTVFTVTVQ